MDFKQQREFIKNNKKLDIKNFNKISEITNMIDFINKEREENIDKEADEAIHSISQFLAKQATQRTFLLGKK